MTKSFSKLSQEPKSISRIPRTFYQSEDTLSIAKELLGKLVIRSISPMETYAVRIVETEAYHGPTDGASHAFRGRTKRNAPMFGPPGFSYVYQIYGVWFCCNVVTGPVEYPAAVLFRAGEMVYCSPSSPTLLAKKVAAGPGKLCRTLKIEKALTNIDLLSSDALWIANDTVSIPKTSIIASPRIGIDYAGEFAKKPWRFSLRDHPDVSKKPPSHCV